MKTHRRRLLRAIDSGSVAWVAGCANRDDGDEPGTGDGSESDRVDPDELPGYVRPSSDPDRVPEPPECDRSRYGWYFQLYDENELEWGDGYDEVGNPALALRVDRLQAWLGDTVTVRLTNVSGGEITTGVRDAYNLELYTEEGWQEIRWMDADIPGVRSEGVFRAPGETV